MPKGSKSKKRPQWIPVVAGLIKKERSYLLGLRPPGHSLPGVWEFPGGKIEPGETPEEALIRELDEELGIQIKEFSLKKVIAHSYEDIGILLIFFEVTYWDGQPKIIHHSDLKWIPVEKITQYPLPEANRLIVEELINS